MKKYFIDEGSSTIAILETSNNDLQILTCFLEEEEEIEEEETVEVAAPKKSKGGRRGGAYG
jgi:hypothetical protein